MKIVRWAAPTASVLGLLVMTLYAAPTEPAARPESPQPEVTRAPEARQPRTRPARRQRRPNPFVKDARLTVHLDQAYGEHERQKLDVYIVNSPTPTPVLIQIHGGGWQAGRKSGFPRTQDMHSMLFDAGISLVSINYRYTTTAPFPAQMQDAARAVQFVRANARKWNLDPKRIAAFGGSAGGQLAGWLAFHDDLADPKSPDPVSRQSTRLSCVILKQTPTDFARIDPVRLIETQEVGANSGPYAKAFCDALACTPAEYNKTERTRTMVRKASPITHLTADDPPVMLWYRSNDRTRLKADHAPVPEIVNEPHDAWYGVLLADKLRTLKIDYDFYLGPGGRPENVPERNARVTAFLTRHLKRRTITH